VSPNGKKGPFRMNNRAQNIEKTVIRMIFNRIVFSKSSTTERLT